MSLEIQTAKLQPNATNTFNFSDNVAQRLVGISGFYLTYGNTDHHVQTISISLSVNQSGSAITVTPHVTMVDANGHNLDQSSSYVTVMAMAWTGVNDDNLKLGNAIGIANGGYSAAIPIPSNNPNILQAALAGFNLSYGSTDHHAEMISAGVGTSLSGTSAAISGTAQMYDDNGHNAATATVDGGLIANSDTSLALYVRSTDNLQTGGKVLSFPGGVSNFQPFLTNFKVQYKNDGDHHIKSFAANILVQSVSGSNVTVAGSATLADNSSNTQDNSLSYVSGFVVGY